MSYGLIMTHPIALALSQKHKHIALVGMMGVGKSTVGGILSKKIKIPLVETDALIEKKAGKPIRDIFNQDGEKYFRDLERQIIAKYLKNNSPIILSTGGGAFVNPGTRNALLDYSACVWLDEDARTTYTRIKGDKARPLLMSFEDYKARLIDRKRSYAQAHIHMTVDGSAEQVAQKVLSKLGEHLKL